MQAFKRNASFFERRFLNSESGSLTIFSLFLFVILLMMAGLAVDMVHHERNRVYVQNTLDVAVLAAASASQDLDSEEVIASFVEAAGIDPDTIHLTTSDVDGETRASAAADVSTGTLFAGLMGINSLYSPIDSEAMESMTRLEISLVLDFSGSMRENAQGLGAGGEKTQALRDAVGDFINLIYQLDCSTGVCTQPNSNVDVTVNIIPYAGTVNPGPEMAEILGMDRWHDWSSCPFLEASDYSNTALPDAESQMPHFVIWTEELDVWTQYGWCPTDDGSILYGGTDPEAIKQYVNDLPLYDGTATAEGFKWGLSLLSPSSRNEMQELADLGVTGDIRDDFPANYTTNTKKVLILMTDGKTTPQVVPTDFSFDALYDNDRPNRPLYDEYLHILDRYASVGSDGEPNTLEEVEAYVQPQVRWNALDDPLFTREEAVANLLQQCALAKSAANGASDPISVYTIRFLNDDDWVENYMRECASEEGFFFDVNDLDIQSAFVSVARHINHTMLALVR
ncbi:pilus assembly protein TadG-related protein [Silicimonas sp. MF1-12-2]|uniref:pilus assembly protein TadG-related protein n=1 Tax=Silicimonas sp. MF1-12-2 TaxID=3384793 RepID=UPI0039B6D3EB